MRQSSRHRCRQHRSEPAARRRPPRRCLRSRRRSERRRRARTLGTSTAANEPPPPVSTGCRRPADRSAARCFDVGRSAAGRIAASAADNPNGTALQADPARSNSPKDDYDLAYGYVAKGSAQAAETFRGFRAMSGAIIWRGSAILPSGEAVPAAISRCRSIPPFPPNTKTVGARSGRRLLQVADRSRLRAEKRFIRFTSQYRHIQIPPYLVEREASRG